MWKKKILIFISCLVTLFMTGCWNYIGLNEMTIVAGVAIDKLDDKYLMSFEIYDLQRTISGNPVRPAIVESSGDTIFDAVRNAKKRISSKLYFAEANIIILSEQIAREDGLNSFLNWFQKDPEIRENLKVIISQEKTAAELLKTQGLTNLVISTDIQRIVEKDQKTTASTEISELYKIYDTINTKGISLTLPAIHIVENNKKKVIELNGIAIFKDDKLVEFLSPEDTQYYLLAKGKIKGGLIVFGTEFHTNEKKEQNVALEIKECSASQEYTSYQENNLQIKLNITMDVALGEFREQFGRLNEDDIKKLEQEANDYVKQRIENMIKKIQKDYNADIMGFGNILYRTNFKKWKQWENKITDEFKNIQIDVNPNINIINTGFSE